MMRRHSLLQRHISEHPVLNPLVSTRTCKMNDPGALPQTVYRFQRSKKARCKCFLQKLDWNAASEQRAGTDPTP